MNHEACGTTDYKYIANPHWHSPDIGPSYDDKKTLSSDEAIDNADNYAHYYLDLLKGKW